MKTLEKLKYIARKAFLVRVSSNEDSNFKATDSGGGFREVEGRVQTLVILPKLPLCLCTYQEHNNRSPTKD